jgi:hypothetical protein
MLIAKVEHRPANLDLGHCPYLPAANVKATSAADFLVSREGSMTAAAPVASPAPPQVLLAHQSAQIADLPARI